LVFLFSLYSLMQASTCDVAESSLKQARLNSRCTWCRRTMGVSLTYAVRLAGTIDLLAGVSVSWVVSQSERMASSIPQPNQATIPV